MSPTLETLSSHLYMSPETGPACGQSAVRTAVCRLCLQEASRGLWARPHVLLCALLAGYPLVRALPWGARPSPPPDHAAWRRADRLLLSTFLPCSQMTVPFSLHTCKEIIAQTGQGLRVSVPLSLVEGRLGPEFKLWGQWWSQHVSRSADRTQCMRCVRGTKVCKEQFSLQFSTP